MYFVIFAPIFELLLKIQLQNSRLKNRKCSIWIPKLESLDDILITNLTSVRGHFD